MKSNKGFVLIEILVSISIMGVIMLLIANLMNMISTNIAEDQFITKQQQISSVIYDDILVATNIELINQCLEITSNSDIIKYCIYDEKLVRTVNNQGYERIMSGFEGRFTNDKIINLEVYFENKKFVLPIWY